MLTAVLLAFGLHTVLGLEPSVVAILGGLLLLALSRIDAADVAKDVEWPTLVFFAGLSAIVDNIPYVATMSPIVKDLVDASGGNDHAQVLWWALAIGADLGGNATAVGASANVVVLGIADRAGHRISFWGFTKVDDVHPCQIGIDLRPW